MDSSLGRRSGGVMRLRRERRGEDWRECSTSEEERERELYSAGLASILAGYARGEPYLSSASEEVPVTERRPPSGSNSPTLPAHYRHHSPSRQASPYPIESTNLTSGTSTPVNPSLSPRFAGGGRSQGYKKPSSLSGVVGKSSTGTLGSRRKHVTSSSSMTSSASSDNCCHSDVTYPEVDRRKELVEEPGDHSPPEPAPPEVPPRGPSLHHPSLGHRARTTPDGVSSYVFPSQVNYDDCADELKQEKPRKEYNNKDYLMPGSPRSYPSKSPDYNPAELNATQHHLR